MPELPDVEIQRRYVNATALHQPIERVHVDDAAVLDGVTPQSLGRMLHGRAFELTRRHGKYVFIRAGGGHWLVLHFGMTGYLACYRHGDRTPSHARFVTSFGNGRHLAYVSQRKLGRITVADSPEAFVRRHRLGPDALALDRFALCDLAARRRGFVKSWLMDQHAMAGIGNVYSDEILFQAGIHPRYPVAALEHEALERLHQSLHEVLRAAIDARADPSRMPAEFLLTHRHADGRCPVCGAALRAVRAAGRRSWFCPDCQPQQGDAPSRRH